MSQVFDAYAQYYDLLYQDKDYSEEADYVAEKIREHSPAAKTILELGCGTGSHAEQLVRMGFSVHGVDSSENMLERAEMRKSQLPAELASRLSFSHGDVRSIEINQSFDIVISLFHVISYQTSNQDLEAAFKTAATHLSSGGLFLFDFWYGPAVLTQQPETRLKRLENAEIKVTRIAEPVLHPNENVVEVNYNIYIEQLAGGEITRVEETHNMRYLFIPELQRFLTSENWSEHRVMAWLANDAPDAESWAACAIAIRK